MLERRTSDAQLIGSMTQTKWNSRGHITHFSILQWLDPQVQKKWNYVSRFHQEKLCILLYLLSTQQMTHNEICIAHLSSIFDCLKNKSWDSSYIEFFFYEVGQTTSKGSCSSSHVGVPFCSSIQFKSIHFFPWATISVVNIRRIEKPNSIISPSSKPDMQERIIRFFDRNSIIFDW